MQKSVNLSDSNKDPSINAKKERQLIRIVPTIFTIASCCLGLTAIKTAVAGDSITAIKLLFAASFLDLIDGPIARYLRVSGEFGKALDSLADVISFGAGPALVMYFWGLEGVAFGWSACLFYMSCCCLRLARYNEGNFGVNFPQGYFAGVPSPGGAALVVMPILLGVTFKGAVELPENSILSALSSDWFLVIWTFFAGLMMIVSIPSISFKSLCIFPSPFRWITVLFGIAIIIGAIENLTITMLCITIFYVSSQPLGWILFLRNRRKGAKNA